MVRMRYESIYPLSNEAFRCSVGIERSLFNKLVDVLAQAELTKKKRGSPEFKPSKPTVPDPELLARISDFFHLGLTYGVPESNADRIVNRVESRLAASGHLD